MMDKRLMLFLGLLLAGALAGVMLWGGARTGGSKGVQTQERIWRGWQGNDRHPFALARDMLARDGIAMYFYRHKEAFPGTHDALLLEDALYGEAQKQEVVAWVESGGLLLLPVHHDLAEAFAVRFAEEDLPEADDRLQWTTREGTRLYPHTAVDARLELNKALIGRPRTGVYANGRLFAVRADYGKGGVVVLGHDFSLWHNQGDVQAGDYAVEGVAHVPLAEGDNAAYLHDLLEGRRSVLVVEKGRLRRLSAAWQWSWPDREWWPLLFVAGLLVAGFLWHHGRRFGPLQPAPYHGGSDIERHLRAAGAYWAEEQGGYAWLADKVRGHILAQLRERKRHYPDEAALLADVAQKSGVPERFLRLLAEGVAVRNEQDFLRFMGYIESIRRVL